MACRGEPTLKNTSCMGTERAFTPAEEFLFVVRFGHELIHADLEFMRKGCNIFQQVNKACLLLFCSLSSACVLPAWQMKALIHADAIEVCWCVSLWFHSQKKFRRTDIFTHSWSGAWRGNCSVLRRNGIFFFFFFWKRKILRRTNSIVAQSPNSIS